MSSLQLLLHLCEKKLDWLDLSINVKKSSCIQVRPRHNAKCKPITTLNGGEMIWVRTARYLGVYISSDHVFRCSLCNSKKSFYRAFNCIYGKIGGVAPVWKC